MKLFLQKNAKFSNAGGSAPRSTKQPPPLQISGYAPGYGYRPLQDFLEKIPFLINTIWIIFRTFLEPFEITKILRFENQLKKLNW